MLLKNSKIVDMIWNQYIKRIIDVCEVIAGQSPEGKYYNKGGDGLPFYQGKKEFTDREIGVPTTWTRKTTKEAFAGDILMSVRAPVGPINLCTQHICIGRGLAAIRASVKVNRDYLFYYLLKHEAEIVGNTGAVFNSINKTQIGHIPIPIPPIQEQKQIVEILDKAFTAIDQAKANIEKNIVNAKELFQSKLNAIFSQKGDGWEEKTLGEVCLKITDGAHHSPKVLYPEKTPGLYPYVTSKNIRNNYMDFSKLQYVDEAFHDPNFLRCAPELGDVLLTKDGANTGNITINTLDEPYSLLSSVALIKTNKEKLYPSFLKYYIQSPLGFKSITGKMTGAAIKRIILRSIKNAKMNIPDIDIQNHYILNIEKLLVDTDKITNAYSKKLINIDDLKKSLLQKAFAGELTSASSVTTHKGVPV